jgi:hypothetical protein
MGTTEEVTIDLDAVSDDSALAVLANRGHRLDSTLEAVENMMRVGSYDLKAFVVLIATNFTRGHNALPRRSIIAARFHLVAR